ncbi:SDR family oxidoreductase [Geotalea sp. SG265]|uniref:SDR family oxidoreductase n=1 Tax=Geotalea sp. SG265 TaxID=2922867 RepID=UPI001FAED7FA|nr:SDR family oxidoreductase [Geotalea sp. SG265]
MTAKPQTIVLTGATGFLGSHLMAALLERGNRLIVLGRPAGSLSLAERIDATLSWFGLHPNGLLLEPVEADLLKPRCGLGYKHYEELCSKAGLIIHCASDTTFSDRNRSRSLAANVTSLNSIILLAADCRASGFHYISTAYSAGIAAGICRETPVAARHFCNVYEETKAMAERRVAEGCNAYGIPFTIIRPSIVYGDSRSGRANRFTAIYHHVRALATIRDIYRSDILNNGGKKSTPHGISLNVKGILHLPLRLTLEKPGTINLVPVEYFVAAALAIMENCTGDAIYHLTNPAPGTVEELAGFCSRFLQIDGLQIDYGSESSREYSPAEELFNRFIEPYRPYLSDGRLFERENTDRATAGLQPPIFSYDIFRRCMDYAVGVDWGRNLTGA